MSESEYILEVNNVSLAYKAQITSIFSKRKPLNVLNNISLSIKKGEIFGLVGESGCGKSTLGRTIVALNREYDGKILLDSENIKNIKNLSRKVQIIFQDPLSSLNPRKKIGWILEEPLRIHKLGNKDERVRKVNRILEIIGLDSTYRDRYPHELSGGQRQRISIGAALMLNPQFLIADEPVSALDVSVQAQILNLMKDLHESLNLSYLFISHNLDIIYYLCDRVAVMFLGEIIEMAGVEEIYDNPRHPYTRTLLNSVPSMDVFEEKKEGGVLGDPVYRKRDSQGCAFYERCPRAGEICKNNAPQLECIIGNHGKEHYVSCHFAG